MKVYYRGMQISHLVESESSQKEMMSELRYDSEVAINQEEGKGLLKGGRRGNREYSTAEGCRSRRERRSFQ